MDVSKADFCSPEVGSVVEETGEYVLRLVAVRGIESVLLAFVGQSAIGGRMVGLTREEFAALALRAYDHAILVGQVDEATRGAEN